MGSRDALFVSSLDTRKLVIGDEHGDNTQEIEVMLHLEITPYEPASFYEPATPFSAVITKVTYLGSDITRLVQGPILEGWAAELNQQTRRTA